MSDTPLIVLEFNELTPSLIQRFIDEGSLPNFRRLRQESRVFTTLAEERPPQLEPWIQWVTVHSGLPYSEHQVFHLNEGHTLGTPRTWEIVADSGRAVWVCGSMNVRSPQSPRASILPDPWCTEVPPSPAELGPFFQFVQRNVLEHTNEQLPVTVRDYAAFLWFMVRHGLSIGTVTAIAAQLLAERSADVRWKRVVLLDLLQYDVFRNYYNRRRPAFSTFFLNSTAHYQHAYWDSMDPESFPNLAPSATQQYRDAIRFGYERMDVLIGRFLALADRSGANLVLCTALSQQPSPDYHEAGGGAFYRPRSFETFAAAVGLTHPFTAQPVMSEQFYLEFASEDIANAAADHLGAVTLADEPLFYVKRQGARLFVGCGIHHDVPDTARFSSAGRSGRFFDFFYRMDTSKTGVHHPEGIFWIRRRDRTHAVREERVPLTAVAPTLLTLVGVKPPSQMKTAPLPAD